VITAEPPNSSRQAGQQPVPAVTQRHSHRGDSRDDEGSLHQPSQHPARYSGRSEISNGNAAGTGIRAVGGDGKRKRPGEYQAGDDQADNVTRMPVSGSRQKTAPPLSGRPRRYDLSFG
jgi:hypothetical protein